MFNIIDLIGIIIVIAAALIAFKRGFVKTFFGFISTFLAIILAFAFCNSGVEMIKNNTSIDELIETTLTKALDKTNESFEIESSNTADTKEKSLINIFENLPDNIQGAVGLEEYKKNTKELIKNSISDVVLKILSWIIIYILARIILWILCIVFDGIMNIPFLKQINNLTGLILGMLLGIFRIYVILAFISFLVPVIPMDNFIAMIKDSLLISVLYENNLLISLIF